jgi:hypothetical protein
MSETNQAPTAPAAGEYPKEVRAHGVRIIVSSPEQERVFLDAPWPVPVTKVAPLETAKAAYLAHAAAREAARAVRIAHEESEDKDTAARRAVAAQRDEQGRLDAEAVFRATWGEEPPALDETKGAA